MNIVIADDYQDCIRTLDCFSLLDGHPVTVYNTAARTRQELIERLLPADVLIVVRERIEIDAALLEALPRLKLISLVGRHSRRIDFAACTARNIGVTHGVSSSPTAPAELTMALMFASRRNVVTEAVRMQTGLWPKTLSHRLAGSTFAIFGFGVIAQRVAPVAKAAGMQVLVWGRKGSLERAAAAGYETAASKADLFTRADVLSVHLRFNDQTVGAITAADLALMKPTALFINTARAELVETDALENALNAGRPGFAAVDVLENEPTFDGDHPLLRMENVICMPHLGWTDHETFGLYFGEAFEQVRRYAAGEPLTLHNPEVVIQRP
ncbi:D-2-hydroxyacid dehydrogenase family protein [soil metagenome]